MRGLPARILPSSPRRRRRLAWVAAALAVVVAIAAAVALLPSRGATPSVFHGKLVPDPVPPKPVAVTPGRRRSINRLLDAFVPSAVARRHVSASFRLVTPALRQGESRARWASGAIPVSPYPAADRPFHGWTLNYAYAGEVNLSLFVTPRKGAHVGPVAFIVDVRRLHGRWLVNSFAPAAVFSPAGASAGITSERDLAPGGAAAGDSARLSSWWILVPASLVGAPLVLGVVYVLVRTLAGGRRRRRPAAEFDDYFRAMRRPAGGAPADEKPEATPGRR